jgi:FAD:protein FMN transferase
MLQETRIIMGMPIAVGIADASATQPVLDLVFDHFTAVDQRFSTYRGDSEISAVNSGRISTSDISDDMREVFALAERTRLETDGIFDIRKPDGSLDPSGIVKGWAIRNAALLIRSFGFQNFFVDAGGDIQTGGKNAGGEDWRTGIRNPFKENEIIKAVALKNMGIATSGSYVRGSHIYDPSNPAAKLDSIVSLTVIASDVLDADRFATAAFAMGDDGIYFIEELAGLEGYMVNAKGIATQTSGFGAFVIQ